MRDEGRKRLTSGGAKAPLFFGLNRKKLLAFHLFSCTIVSEGSGATRSEGGEATRI